MLTDCEVVRLKNSPKGQPYAIEKIKDLTYEAASQRAAAWWESRGTIAVVVFRAGKEDARYEHDYMEAPRVPEGWTVKKAPTGETEAPKPKAPPPPPPKPQPAPTVANEGSQAQAEVCRGCGRRKIRSRAVASRDPRHCSECGQAFGCPRCGQDYPEDRKYEGDNDPTPSGRLADRRCPSCGAPLRHLTGRQIWALYTGR